MNSRKQRLPLKRKNPEIFLPMKNVGRKNLRSHGANNAAASDREGKEIRAKSRFRCCDRSVFITFFMCWGWGGGGSNYFPSFPRTYIHPRMEKYEKNTPACFSSFPFLGKVGGGGEIDRLHYWLRFLPFSGRSPCC